jgi:hypothetical protein
MVSLGNHSHRVTIAVVEALGLLRLARAYCSANSPRPGVRLPARAAFQLQRGIPLISRAVLVALPVAQRGSYDCNGRRARQAC